MKRPLPRRTEEVLVEVHGGKKTHAGDTSSRQEMIGFRSMTLESLVGIETETLVQE